MKRTTNADKAEIIIKRRRPADHEKRAVPPQKFNEDLREGRKVSLIIGQETDKGFKALINNRLEGFLYKNEVFQPLEKGQKVEGFIKKIRDDKKIDLSLYKPGYKKVDALSERIIKRLRGGGGFIPVTDKSSPAVISELFGVSKKTYKMVIGGLYKKRIILIEDDGIRLKNEAHPPSPHGLRRAGGARRRAQDKNNE
ncbi:MAG: hypothetical protein JW944_04405 [Deltaproteobacteria bacterium]|nr:hypothetical protein [Deltaproteobacteria bacterium]